MVVRVYRKELAQRGGLKVQAGGIRFNAAADALTRTTNLPVVSNFTMMGWYHRSVNIVGWQGWLCVNSAANDNFIGVTQHSTGLTGLYVGQGAPDTTLTNVLNRWTHYAIVISGTGTDQALLYINGNVESTGTLVGGFDPGSLNVSSNPFTEWINGRVASYKVYDASLSQTEIKREMRYVAPVRTLSLNTWLPLLGTWQNSKLDYSGNRYHMTTGGTLSIEPGPMLLWTYKPVQRKVRKAGVGGGVLYTHTLESSATAVSTIVKSVGKVVGGSVLPSSTLSKLASRNVSGNITAVSGVTKVVYRVLSGSLTAVSAVIPSFIASEILNSVITATSAVSKSVVKVVSSSVTAQSGVVKMVSRVVNSSSGAVSGVSKIVYRNVSGSITAISSATTQIVVGLFIHVFEASITAVSTINKVVIKQVSESVVIGSAVNKVVLKVVGGSVSGVSQVVKVVSRSFGGSVTAVSSLTRNRVLSRVFNSSITALSAVVTEVITGSGVVARHMWLFVRRRRRSK